MKKSKIIVATLTAAAIAAGCGAFAGCKDGNKGGGENPPAHVHNWATTWTTTDDTNHWYACLNSGHTGDQKDVAPHEYDNAQDTTCNICGHVRTVSGGEQEGPGEGEDPTTTSISLDKETLTLGIGNTEAELTATISNGEADAVVEWSSDNEAVVLVGETGAVEALKPGSATITATIKDTEIKATCDVLVEDAYYIIGGQDSAWNKCAAFGVESVIYFMPTETEGIYKTASFELAKLGNFQVAKVGLTADDWWKSAYNGDYIAANDTVLSKNGGGNIAVQNHGKYTITLDLTGDTAVISGVCDKTIDDGDVETVYYLIGGMNGWTLAGTKADAGDYALTDNGDGTYSGTVKLTQGQEFKIAQVGMAWNVEFAESALAALRDSNNPCDCTTTLIGTKNTATTETEYQLEFTSSANIGVGVTGWYTFTLNPTAEAHHQLTYTFSSTNPNA